MTTQTNQSNAKPTHRLYIVTGEGKNAHWQPIAAAWPHRDGRGFSIKADAVPLTGQIVMRAITEKPSRDAAD